MKLHALYIANSAGFNLIPNMPIFTHYLSTVSLKVVKKKEKSFSKTDFYDGHGDEKLFFFEWPNHRTPTTENSPRTLQVSDSTGMVVGGDPTWLLMTY